MTSFAINNVECNSCKNEILSEVNGPVLGPTTSTPDCISVFVDTKGDQVRSTEVSVDAITNTLTTEGSLVSTGLGLSNGIASNTVTIKVSADADEYTLTLPKDTGGADQVLQTDGNGATKWATSAGTGTVVGPVASTFNAIATYADVTGKVLLNNSTVQVAGGNLTAGGDLECGGGGVTNGKIIWSGANPQVTTLSVDAGSAGHDYTWPKTAPAAGSILTCDAGGQMDWVTSSVGQLNLQANTDKTQNSISPGVYIPVKGDNWSTSLNNNFTATGAPGSGVASLKYTGTDTITALVTVTASMSASGKIPLKAGLAFGVPGGVLTSGSITEAQLDGSDGVVSMSTQMVLSLVTNAELEPIIAETTNPLVNADILVSNLQMTVISIA